MRFNEIVTEATYSMQLFGNIKQAAIKTINETLKKTTREYLSKAKAEIRKELGYHPYYDEAQEYKTFNSDEFEDILLQDNISIQEKAIELFDEDCNNTPPGNPYPNCAYLTNMLGDNISKVLRDYLIPIYGKTTYIDGELTKLSNIKVVYDWNKTNEHDGVFSTRTRTDYGEYGSTLSTYVSLRASINVDDVYLNAVYNQAFFDYITGESIDYIDLLTALRMELLLHEISHLLQALKSGRGNKSIDKALLKSFGKERHGYHRDPKKVTYVANVKEIDAEATAVSGKIISDIEDRYETDDRIINELEKALEEIRNDKFTRSDFLGWPALIKKWKKEGHPYNPKKEQQYQEELDKVKNRYIKKIYQNIRSYIESKKGS